MPSVIQLPPPAEIILWSRQPKEKPCQPVEVFDEKLRHLIDVLKSTCYASNGVGLAAPQIGEHVRVAVIHYPQDKPAFPIINPVIDDINSKGEQTAYESCLSLPTEAKVNVHVRRCQDLVFSYQDITGRRIEEKVSGMLARAVAHECDHLDNLFYIDRIGELSRSLVMKSFQRYVKKLEYRPLAKGAANL